MTADSPTSRPTSETDRSAIRTATSGDVWIGGEPFVVDDETQTLVHAPCGKHLFGDSAIAAHVCWFDDHNNLAGLLRWAIGEGWNPDELADMVEKPWHYRDEAVEAGVA